MTFTEEKFARMLSLAVTVGLLGAIYGGQPVSYMTESLGYKTVVELFAVLGVVLAIATYLIVPDTKATHSGTVYSDLKEVLGNTKVIWTCLLAGLMVGPMEGFADVWATVFLKQVYGLDNATASRLPSMIFIGMCFGAPILNYIAEKTRNYLGTIIVAGIFMAISFFTLISKELTNSHIMLVSFIVVGIACAYQILAIYKASTYVRDEVVGLTTAVANMIIMSFGYAFHTLIGLIINMTGGTDSSDAFIYGISIIPVMLSIGVVGFSVLLYREPRDKKLIK
jgi:predicted MFS family arabinose efflux permease